MNQCPNCGAGSSEITQQGSDYLCGYCGFCWNTSNAINATQQPGQNMAANDDSVVIRNISIGRVKKSKNGSLYYREKESRHSDSEATSIVVRDFNESAGIIYHSDEEAVAICKCGNMIFREEFVRCSFCRKPLCGTHQRRTKDGKVYCGTHYWLSRICLFLLLIIKVPFILLGQVLSLLFLKEKA